MQHDSPPQRKAQLDKAEREHLEAIVTAMRDRIEDNVRFQLTQANLDTRPSDDETLDEATEQLVDAIELEAVDDTEWDEALEEYVDGVGYTIVNRLAALRCMEVRGFIDEEVTVFKDNGLTPAAETLVHEEFLLEDEAILAAYHNACDELAEEIEILFDRSSAYSLIDPDDDTFEELCGMLDRVDDEVWRADDVLGWVYEYYNVKLLDDLRRKGDREGLDPEDVPPANQFYTPHWVVRMLTDNSLGKLYLEHTGELQDVVDAQASFDPDERKNRPLSPDESPDIADFCTYLVPSEEAGEPTEFDHPRELRVIDPACGSGHFLLYAFDVLERIWRAETDVDHEQIPRQILRHNLYGVDLDMRACQLAAFNLYLKGRTRAEAEGADGFEMPEVGIVCADASVAEVDGVEAVFDEVAGDDPEVQRALERILDAFEEVHGLGSLLDVRGTIGDLFEDDAEIGGTQLTLGDDPRESHSLGQVLSSLREAVADHQAGDSFLAQDLRSFVRLLDILAQDYDVALMNPPYGSRNRMPDAVKKYIDSNYKYPAEFYISFFEVCDGLIKKNGRTGMLVPRTFMFKVRAEEFRSDFIGGEGSFDFLTEFGLGILDNATVRTVGTVVRSGVDPNPTGDFIRLYDVNTENKEETFAAVLSGDESIIKRLFNIRLSSFSQIPGSTICYSIPEEVREFHTRDLKLDTDVSSIEGDSIGYARQGVATTNDFRFMRFHWEIHDYEIFRPIATGGSDAWILPQILETVEWRKDGRRIRRYGNTVRTPNEFLYGKEGLAWTRSKETGRRFGYYTSGGLFSQTGYLFVPKESSNLWQLLAGLNSNLYHALFLSLTVERDWVGGIVGRAPWLTELEEAEKLEEMAKEQFDIMASMKTSDPTSPYYISPDILPLNDQTSYFYEHPHTEQTDLLENKSIERLSKKDSIHDAATNASETRLSKRNNLEAIARNIDNIVYDATGISQDTIKRLEEEIELRTGRSITQKSDGSYSESVSDVPDNIDTQVKDLVHHFAMEAVRAESDGIIPLHSVDGQPNMLDRIVERFEAAYGEHAEDRLIEVDEILGAESATEEAYPNLRQWVDEELFDYHVSRMENTPIVWKFTTERLLADSTGEGFACFLDYHSLDASLFDRLSKQYLEPRKAELREQRSAANRRRGDDSLSATEQAEAAELYERCASGLDQISVFEEVLQQLGSTTEREFDDEDREQLEELAPKIAVFREETRQRVETLAELRESEGEKWFKKTFSDKFWEAVDEWRDEWIDALSELEHACQEYAKPVDEPVEAHLADLFDYFNWRLKGSDHYSSSGILFLTYYFEREGADLLDDDGQPFENLTESEHRLASLAMGLDDASIVDSEYLEAMTDDGTVADCPPLAEFKALAEEIDDRCQVVDNRIPSEWSGRALSEITTAGYQPNQKHGVAINITPLVDAEIVPKIVDEKVI